MKIYTYKNPFKLKDEKFWDEIRNYPNLCVSQTLVMGMSQSSEGKYVRKDYKYIYTIDSFINKVYKDWSNNPTNSIEQYILCSQEIEKISCPDLRQTFKFNKAEVVSALRMLVELGIRPEEINEQNNRSIGEFKKIYTTLLEGDVWNQLDKIRVDNDLLKKSFDTLLDDEIRDLEKMSVGNVSIETVNAIIKKINELRNIRDSIPVDYKMDKIFIHGVHKFTPMIMRLINDLENIGVEVIFVINYINEFGKTYETWQRVYSWTGLGVPVSNGEIYKKGNLGESIALLLEGKMSDFKRHEIEYIKFENLSSFCDYVSTIYKDASKLAGKNKRNRIFKMRQQFYATNMEDVNNILKQYHPEQFGNKHFLAYPIGQFIINIYNMWDAESRSLKVESKLLKECLSVGFFQQVGRPNPVEIYNKLEVYYENLKIEDNYSINELLNRLEILKKDIFKIEKCEKNKGEKSLLRKFSMYTLSIEELDYFINVINSLIKVSKELFLNGHRKINFVEHYSNLLEILSGDPEDDFLNMENISKEEREMIDEIKLRISEIKEVDIEGSMDDLRESLHFYLTRIDEQEELDNQASWIVRNFEQLDGGVLLKDTTDSGRDYHIALVGDLDMNFNIRSLFPWPIDEGFFLNNQFGNRNYVATLTSFMEYRNFLRYSLFYATYYLDRKIKISYVENYGKEKNVPYYIFNILGLEASAYRDNVYGLYNNRIPKRLKPAISMPIDYNPDIDEIKNFIFCEYKYFLDEIIDGNTFYNSEYLQNLYYQTLLLTQSWEKLEGKSKDKIIKTVKRCNLALKKYLILWNEINFLDAENKAIHELLNNVTKGNVVRSVDKNYINTRKKFIYAKISDSRVSGNGNLIREVLLADKSYATVNDIHNFVNYSKDIKKNQETKKCEFCSQNHICLYGYREVE